MVGVEGILAKLLKAAPTTSPKLCSCGKSLGGQKSYNRKNGNIMEFEN